jgi:restriction system protein
MVRINRSPPTDWRDLQRQVCQILQECGLDSESDKEIQTVRGRVNVDVYALDAGVQPRSVYVCECKCWRSNVPKNTVHAFRTVVNDYGANWGFIISSAGFQSGAFEAARNSNIKLLTWDEFELLFLDRWIDNYMTQCLVQLRPLVEYTEPVNSRIFEKANKLSEPSFQRFRELRDEYQTLAFLTLLYTTGRDFVVTRRPDLPIRTATIQIRSRSGTGLPDEILDASCLRDFVNTICKHAEGGIKMFDELFGGRA